MRDYRNRWEKLYGTSKKVPKRKKEELIAGMLILAVVSIAVLAVVGILFSKGRSDSGTVLLPEREIVAAEPVFFMQRDPEWAGDKLGSSNDTMASSGCLVTAIASGLDMQAKAENRDFSITPGELNKALTAADAYTDGGAVVWDKVQNALPETDVFVTGTVSGEVINGLLTEGRFPVVKVRVGGNGAYHWVLLAGTKDGHYVCMDPLSGSGELVSLESFADVVYSVRAVFLREE